MGLQWKGDRDRAGEECFAVFVLYDMLSKHVHNSNPETERPKNRMIGVLDE